jgi:hypothetical protein
MGNQPGPHRVRILENQQVVFEGSPVAGGLDQVALEISEENRQSFSLELIGSDPKRNAQDGQVLADVVLL